MRGRGRGGEGEGASVRGRGKESYLIEVRSGRGEGGTV